MTRRSRFLPAIACAIALFLTAPALAHSPRRGGMFRVPASDAVDPHQNGRFASQICASLA
jgi:hypothetical protein